MRASLAAVRATLARAWLQEAVDRELDTAAPLSLGSIVLRPHQCEAVARVHRSLEEFGGALLADQVGLGKTFVALAIAARASRPLLVTPAALRPMWQVAQGATGVRMPIVSHERLSRGGAGLLPGAQPDLIVVDEAHHARNPRTRRYAALARIAAGARVLLLTATPVHNRGRDLHALLGLFLGARAAELDDAALVRCVVRRDHARTAVAGTTMPRIAPTITVELPRQDDLLARLLALPPPLPPADGGDGGALVSRTLVRQWSSSVGALRAALRRRLATAEGLGAALEQGLHPTAAELRSWVVDDHTVQLALPMFDEVIGDASTLLAAVRLHAHGVRSLLGALPCDGDGGRADALRAIRDRHPSAPIIAFSHSADTVASLYDLLERDGGICALDGGGAIVAGGRLTRSEALDRFAPRARGRSPPREAERISLLLTTDLLSEGVNLQDASVVVHLDLPWTPARLEQRVGRAARLDSPHHVVHVYTFAPPASAEALLGVERALETKRRAARSTLGTEPEGGPSPDGATTGPVSAAERLHVLMREWRHAAGASDGADHRGGKVPAISVAESRTARTALAGVRVCGGAASRIHLLAIDLVRGDVCDHPEALLRIAEHASGPVRSPSHHDARRALHLLRRWSRHETATSALALEPTRTARLKRRTAGRLAAELARVPRDSRATAAARADRARASLRRRMGAGAVSLLETLLADRSSGEAWLAAAATLVAELGSDDADVSSAGATSLEPLALLFV